LVAQLNEVRSLLCRFTKQNAVIGDNSNLKAAPTGKAAH